MSAIDQFNAKQSAAIAEESLDVQNNIDDRISKINASVAEFNKKIDELVTVQKMQMDYNSRIAENIQLLHGNVKDIVDVNSAQTDVLSKVANTKDVVKSNKKDGILKKAFYSLMGRNLRTLIKKIDKGNAINAKTKNVVAGSGGGEKTETSITNKANIDAKAAAGMGQAIGGIMAKHISPSKLIKAFITEMLPKILIAILLLTMFIQAWFNTDIKTAFFAAIAIVVNIFMLYVAWLVARTLFKIAFEIACTVLTTGAKLAAISFELMSSFMVYAAWMVIIPLVLLCFVLLVAIIAVVIVAILVSIVKIVDVVSNAIMRATELFFDFLSKLLFGTTEQKEEKKENGANISTTEDVNKALLAFTNAATTAVSTMIGIADVVQYSALAVLAASASAMGILAVAVLAWLTNPFTMMLLAAAALAGALSSIVPISGGDTNDNKFTQAIEPLLAVTKDIRKILKSFASANETMINKSIITTNVNRTTTNVTPNTNTAVPSDDIAGGTTYISAAATKTADSEKIEELKAAVVEAINKQTAEFVKAITTAIGSNSSGLTGILSKLL